MKNVAVVVVVLAILGAAAYLVAAPPRGGTQFGQGIPEGAAVTTVGDLTAQPEAYQGKEVVVKGKLVEVCPTTGCWGRIDDGTGVIRWDSAASGWALPPSKSGKEITVRGPVSVNETGAPEIAAVGARL
jgi:hypothetical protein